MIYTLKKPVQATATTAPIVELSFREEVVAGDLRGIKVNSLQNPEIDDLLKIAGRLCGQPDVVMNKLSFTDLLEVVGVVGDFLSDGLPTGTTPSP